MTDTQRAQIIALRKKGQGYKKIAKLTGISENTVKSYLRRKQISDDILARSIQAGVCPTCGATLICIPGKKPKKFCSDRCRMRWWNTHLDQVNRKANYDFTCPACKKTFTVYGNANRKYCCHACYIADRFGGGR